MTNKNSWSKGPVWHQTIGDRKIKNSYIFASETCALDIVGATFIREVENGEIVVVEKDELKSIKPFPKQKSRPVYLSIFILLDQTVL